MNISRINNYVNYKSQLTSHTNSVNRDINESGDKKKKSYDYKKIGAITFATALVLLGIAKHKSILSFIKKFGKEAEQNIKNDVKDNKSDVIIPEDYPQWHPPIKPKKNAQPTDIIVDSEGNIIGKQGVNRNSSGQNKTKTTGKTFSFSDLLKDIQDDTRKYRAGSQKEKNNYGKPKNNISDGIPNATDAVVDAMIIDDLINMSRGGAGKVSSGFDSIFGTTEAELGEGLSQEAGNIFERMGSSFDDITSGLDDFLSKTGDAIDGIGDAMGDIFDGVL